MMLKTADLTSSGLFTALLQHSFHRSLMLELLHSSLLRIHLLHTVVLRKLCQHLHAKIASTVCTE